MRQSGTTVLLSTHYMFEAESLCDRIAIMNEGRVSAEGTVDELRERFIPNELVRSRASRRTRPSCEALAARLKASRLALSVVYEPNGMLVSCPEPRKTIAAMYAFLKTTPESVTLLDVAGTVVQRRVLLATQKLPDAGSRVTFLDRVQKS